MIGFTPQQAATIIKAYTPTTNPDAEDKQLLCRHCHQYNDYGRPTKCINAHTFDGNINRTNDDNTTTQVTT